MVKLIKDKLFVLRIRKPESETLNFLYTILISKNLNIIKRWQTETLAGSRKSVFAR